MNKDLEKLINDNRISYDRWKNVTNLVNFINLHDDNLFFILIFVKQ